MYYASSAGVSADIYTRVYILYKYEDELTSADIWKELNLIKLFERERARLTESFRTR